MAVMLYSALSDSKLSCGQMRDLLAIFTVVIQNISKSFGCILSLAAHNADNTIQKGWHALFYL